MYRLIQTLTAEPVEVPLGDAVVPAPAVCEDEHGILLLLLPDPGHALTPGQWADAQGVSYVVAPHGQQWATIPAAVYDTAGSIHWTLTDGLPTAATVVQTAAAAEEEVVAQGFVHLHNHTEYCLAPETLVVTRDMVWKPIGDVVPGEVLVGFDEDLRPPEGERGRSRSKMRPTEVLATKRVMRECYRITLEDGTQIVASAQHGWVANGTSIGSLLYPGGPPAGYGANTRRWITTDRLKPGKSRLILWARPWEPLPPEQEADAAYLAGILDGEGWISHGQLSIGQNPGLVMDRIMEVCQRLGYPTTEVRQQGRGADCLTFRFQGYETALRVLSQCPSVRLSPRMDEVWVGRRAGGRYSRPVLVTSLEYLGQRETVAIQTTTKTFVAEGFLSHNSALDGLTKVEEAIEVIKADGQNALGISDHNVVAGHPEFLAACRKAGVRPVLGYEANLVEDRHRRGRTWWAKVDPATGIEYEIDVEGLSPEEIKKMGVEKRSDSQEVLGDYHHLTLWAMNDTGLRNIWAISTIGYTEGFYGRPKIDWEVLERFSEGVIAATGCLRGPLARPYLDGHEEVARTNVARLAEIYGDRLYVEIHSNRLDDQIEVNKFAVRLGREMGLPLLAVTDSHYPTREDDITHRSWLAKTSSQSLSDETTLFAGEQDYHLATAAEVREALAYLDPQAVDEAVENTAVLANRCSVTFGREPDPPNYSKPTTAHPDPVAWDEERLWERIMDGWERKVAPLGEAGVDLAPYEERLVSEEWPLITDKRFCFPAGTSILMGSGEPVPIEKVNVGDVVVTRTGVGTVVRTQQKMPESLLSLKVRGSAWDVVTTPDHPIWVKGHGWMEASEVRPGDFVRVMTAPAHSGEPFPLLEHVPWDCIVQEGRLARMGPGRYGPRQKMGWCPIEVTLDEDWGWLIGLWIAEGHREVLNSTKVCWTLREGEPALDRLLDTIRRLGLGTPRVYSKRSPSEPSHRGVVVKVTNHPLWWMLGRLVGDGTRGKRLHPWLANHPQAHLLVSGWFDGDGTTTRGSRRVVDTVNPVLARQLRAILLRSGQWASTSRFIRPDDGVESYRVSWSPAGLRAPHDAVFENGQWWAKVKTVKAAPPEQVYSLTVAGDPSYVAENVLVHNCGYFLVVSDYVRNAKFDQKILVGPGRGSGGGCLIAWLTDITELDPVKFDLMFGRFLNPGRTELPDFDVDFPASKREAIKGYVVQRWGEDRTVSIGTTRRVGIRAAIDGAIRVLRPYLEEHEIPGFAEIKAFKEAEGQSKAAAAGTEVTWETFVTEHEDLITGLQERYPLVMAMTENFVGRVDGYGKHPAGVVVSTDEPLTYLPMRVDDEGNLISQFDMNALAALGFTKFDLLTLRTLDTLQVTVDLIRERYGVEIDFYSWNEQYEDPQVWEEISNGNTLGIFQIETHLGTQLCKAYRPASIDDLAAVITLVRPGPRRSGLTDQYLRRRDGKEPVTYVDPRLEEALAPTYGVPIYQEQVMAITMILAGYDTVKADQVRSILGKKKVDKVAAAGVEFVAAAVERGMERKAAETLWAQLAEFAKYGFGKAHAYGYAVLGYWAAWLKFHFPVQFLTACLSTVDNERIPEFVNEARKMGYDIALPDINESGVHFTPLDTKVRYGLADVPGIGEPTAEHIVARQPYTSLEDFRERALGGGGPVNLGHLRALVRIGAFDSIIPNRRAAVMELDAEADKSLFRCVFKDDAVSGPNGLPCTFDWANEPDPPMVAQGRGKNKVYVPKPPPARCTKACRNYTPPPPLDPAAVEPYSHDEIMELEKETLGVWLSATPFDRVPQDILEGLEKASQVQAGDPGEYVVAATIEGVRQRTDRTGGTYAFLTLFAQDGLLEGVCFASVYSGVNQHCKPGRLVFAVLRKDASQRLEIRDVIPSE